MLHISRAKYEMKSICKQNIAKQIHASFVLVGFVVKAKANRLSHIIQRFRLI